MKKLLTLAVAAFAFAAISTAADAEMQKVRIGTEGAYPPFNSIDENGVLVGFDIDIANALCVAANFECEFVVQDWDGIIDGLTTNKYDAIIASMSITEKRMEVVDFTEKYYNTPAKFIANKGTDLDFTEGTGLEGAKVGVQGATIHEDFVRMTWPGAEVVTYATQDEANADLISGRVDLVMADSVALDFGFLQTDAGACCEFVGADYNDPKIHGEGAGIAIRKGEEDLRVALDAALAQILSDGTYKEINDHYFNYNVYGEDLPAM
ncbi:MAG: transporter substrate-binding domain-containing protein [Dongiaceae bacterium]